jgi:hypothetical protein
MNDILISQKSMRQTIQSSARKFLFGLDLLGWVVVVDARTQFYSLFGSMLNEQKFIVSPRCLSSSLFRIDVHYKTIIPPFRFVFKEEESSERKNRSPMRPSNTTRHATPINRSIFVHLLFTLLRRSKVIVLSFL